VLPRPPEGLRHWQPADAPALEAAWRDPEITRWNPAPGDLDAAAWIAGAEERWTRRLALDLVIEPPPARDVGTVPFEQVAGEVGFSSFTAGPARAELGVWIAPPHRRAGVATAAVATAAAWALDELDLDQVWARTDLANAAALALFAGLGWQRLGESGGKAIWSVARPLLR